MSSVRKRAGRGRKGGKKRLFLSISQGLLGRISTEWCGREKLKQTLSSQFSRIF
jgi:hypothetical protein